MSRSSQITPAEERRRATRRAVSPSENILVNFYGETQDNPASMALNVSSRGCLVVGPLPRASQPDSILDLEIRRGNKSLFGYFRLIRVETPDETQPGCWSVESISPIIGRCSSCMCWFTAPDTLNSVAIPECPRCDKPGLENISALHHSSTSLPEPDVASASARIELDGDFGDYDDYEDDDASAITTEFTRSELIKSESVEIKS